MKTVQEALHGLGLQDALPEEVMEANADEITSLELCLFCFPRIQQLDAFRQLASLTIVAQDIARIEGLESCTALRELWIAECRVARIENLGGLVGLERLFLYGNRIAQIENLDTLENLETLWLADNEIARVENLGSLRRLRELNLANNRISAVGPEARLSDVPLETLNLSGNHICSVDALGGLADAPRLRHLQLNDPDYAPNPVCFLFNHIVHVHRTLPLLDEVDRVAIDAQFRRAAQASLVNKNIYYHMRRQVLKRNARFLRNSARDMLISAARPLVEVHRLGTSAKETVADGLLAKSSGLFASYQQLYRDQDLALERAAHFHEQCLDLELASGANTRLEPLPQSRFPRAWDAIAALFEPTIEVNAVFLASNRSFSGALRRACTPDLRRVLFDTGDDRSSDETTDEESESADPQGNSSAAVTALGRLAQVLVARNQPDLVLKLVAYGVDPADENAALQSPEAAAADGGYVLLCAPVFQRDFGKMPPRSTSLSLTAKPPPREIPSVDTLVRNVPLLVVEVAPRAPASGWAAGAAREALLCEPDLPLITPGALSALLEPAEKALVAAATALQSQFEQFTAEDVPLNPAPQLDASVAAQLTSLTLSNCGLQDLDSLHCPWRSLVFPQLATLDLSGIPLGRMASLGKPKSPALVQSRQFPVLHELRAANCNIAGVASLVEESLSQLRRLDVSDNDIAALDTDTINLLRGLGSLQELCIGGNPVAASLGVFEADAKWRRVLGQVKLILAVPLDTASQEMPEGATKASCGLDTLDETTQRQTLCLAGNTLTTASALFPTLSTSAETLVSLDLADNELASVQALESLPNLAVLNLQNNRLVSLRGLQKLQNLSELYASNNCIAHLPTLLYLRHCRRLLVLDILGNPVTTSPNGPWRALITAHLGASLQVLNGRRLQPQDVQLAREQHHGRLTVEHLLLWVIGASTELLDCEVALVFRRLSSLNLAGCRLRDLDCLARPETAAELCNLREIVLDGNQLSSLDGLAHLPQLTAISANDNRLARLLSVAMRQQLQLGAAEESVAPFAALVELSLGGNHVARMSDVVIRGLDNLRILRLHSNRLTKADAQIVLPRLEELALDHNQLKRVDPGAFSAALYPALAVLHLNDNRLPTITGALAGLPASLRVLHAHNNRIGDFGELGQLHETLRPCVRLQALTLCGNPFASRASFRSTALLQLPWIQELDQQPVTDADRQQADQYKRALDEQAAAAAAAASLVVPGDTLVRLSTGLAAVRFPPAAPARSDLHRVSSIGAVRTSGAVAASLKAASQSLPWLARPAPKVPVGPSGGSKARVAPASLSWSSPSLHEGSTGNSLSSVQLCGTSLSPRR